MGRAVAALLLAVMPAAAGASDKPAKVAITPQSDEAAVIWRAPSLRTEYQLVLAKFDPVESNTTAGPLGGWANLTVESGRDGVGWFVKRIKPGIYVVNSLNQQTSWANCYHADTLQFEVKAGQLLYLGEFDGAVGVAQLQRNAVLHGDLMVRQGQFHHYFDGIAAPGFAPVDAAGLDAAAAFSRTAMPRTTVAPTAVAFRSARFGTGSTLFGERVCGGYFKKKVEPAGPAPGGR